MNIILENIKSGVFFENFKTFLFYLIFILFTLSSLYYIFSASSTPDDKMHYNFMINHDGWFLGQNHHGFGAIFWWIGKLIAKFTVDIATGIIAIKIFIFVAAAYSVYFFVKNLNSTDRILYSVLIFSCPFMYYHLKIIPEFLNIALVLFSFTLLKKHSLYAFFLMGLAIGIKINSLPAVFLLLSYYSATNITKTKELTKFLYL